MTRLITIAITILLSVSSAWGETLYVSQAGNGTADGTSYENRAAATWFNTLASWDTDVADDGKIGPGDTVYVCGTITQYLQPRRSGSEGNPITIRFDYAGDAGVIDGTVDIKGVAGDWTDANSDGIWEIAAIPSVGDVANVYFDGALGNKTASPAALGDWAYDTSARVLSVYAGAGVNPTTAFSTIRRTDTANFNAGQGIYIYNKSYLTLVSPTVRYINYDDNATSGGLETDSYSSTRGGIMIAGTAGSISSNIIVNNPTVIGSRTGINILYSDTVPITNPTIKSYKLTSGAYLASGIYFSGDNVTVNGGTIDNSVTLYNGTTLDWGHGIQANISAKGVAGHGALNFVVKNTTVKNVYLTGILAFNTSNDVGAYNVNGLIENNTITDGRMTGGVDTDGIGIGDTTDAANYSYGVTVRKNRVNGYGNSCIHVANDWQSVLVYSNIGQNCGTTTAGYGGIRFAVGTGNVAYNNTLYNIAGDGIRATADNATVITNNLIHTVAKQSSAKGSGVSCDVGCTGANNLIYGAASADVNFTHSNGLTSNPILDSDLRPAANSPALWQRATLGSPYDTDYEGLWFGDRGAPIGARSQGLPRSRNTAGIR